jgi:ABC-2 type transport system ATP-binding protein
VQLASNWRTLGAPAEAKLDSKDNFHATESPVIAVRGLQKSYGRRRVLSGLDLTVERGAAIGLLGANGAGKTTLIKAILGLVPMDSGRSTVLGDTSAALSPEVRARLAYVPQSPSQFPWLTGRAMLKYVSSFYRTFDWDYVHDLASRWKLALRSVIGVLSPGQQQRLSIVRALATRPDVLILDEPIASLDPATRIAVIDELISEQAKRSITVVFSSHLIGDLERLCSKFAVLSAGRIAVLEEVNWFRGLVRVSLQGDEGSLAGLSFPAAALVRNAGAGRRIALLENPAAERLAAGLPKSITVSIDRPDVEAVASEWMQ